MANLQLPFGVRVLNPTPVEDKYLNDGVPYTATTQVNSLISAGIRYTGLTVNILGEEYWYKTGVTNSALVLKTSSSSGGITGATNGLTKIGNNVVLGGTLTGNTNIIATGDTFSIANNFLTFNSVSFEVQPTTIVLSSSNDLLSTNATISTVGSSASIMSDGNASGTFTLYIDANDQVYFDDQRTTPVGVEYFADYSANFTDRSLVDKEYVDNTIATSGSTADNGLTKTGSNIQLGGDLVDDTSIGGNSGAYSLCVGSIASPLNNYFNVGYGAATIDFPTISINGDSANKTIVLDSTGIEVTLNNNDFRFAADYSANYGDRSIVDKAYVDSIAAGLDPKESVRVATVAALTGGTYTATGGSNASGSFSGVDTIIDGVLLVDGDRILVKNQVDAKQNGIYIVVTAASGDWERAADQDGSPSNEVSAGNFTFVETGDTYQASGWVLTGDGILTLNTDNINWVQFSAAIAAYLGGDGIDITGPTISVDLDTISGLEFNSGELRVNAENGLQLSSNGALVLGGILTGNTVIQSSDYSFTLGDGNATGANSTIIGGTSGSYAYGDCSHVIGYSYVGNGAHGAVAIGTYNRVCDGAYNSVSMGYNSVACSPHTIAIGNAARACGFAATAIGSNTCANAGGSLTLGIGGLSTCTTGVGSSAIAAGFATGSRAKAWGFRTCATGSGSTAIGDALNITIPYLLAAGNYSINMGHNNASQTAGHGALANTSVIIGGLNSNIAFGNTRAVLLGGNTIKVTGSSYADHVIVPSLAVFTAPSAGDTSDSVLVWNASDKKVKSVTQASVSALITANNGLTKSGSNIRLGGSLTGDTLVNVGTYGIAFADNNSCSTGIGSFATGKKSCATGNYSVAMGYCATSVGDTSFAGNRGLAYGARSAAFGSAMACGTNGFAANAGRACGSNSSAAFGSSCTLAPFSFVAGDTNIIASGNTNAVLIGGVGIDLTGSSYANHTVVPNLAIWTAPTTGDSSDSILVWNASDKKVKQRSTTSLSNVYTITSVSANTTLTSSNYVVIVDSSSSGLTMTLPDTPQNGQAYKIKDNGNALTNSITVSGNGKNIDGTSTASINTDYGALEIVYSSTEDEWFTLAFIN